MATTIKSLNKRSDVLVSRMNTLGDDIHTHLNNMLHHVLSQNEAGDYCKDVSAFTYFVIRSEMQQGDDKQSVVRVKAIKDWIATFGLASFGKTKDGKSGYTLDRKMFAAVTATTDEKAAHIKLAAETVWHKFSPEKDAPSFDFEKALAQLVKRAEKADANREEYKSVSINVEKLAKVAALLS